MKYSKEFKLRCVKMHMAGERIPDGWFASRRKTFLDKVRTWVALYGIHGEAGLGHMPKNRRWAPEERLALVSRVLGGESLRAVAAEEGMEHSPPLMGRKI